MAERGQEAARWYALCAAGALDNGAIHRTELHGEGLVVWRADDGRVNVWEDRCPHRGVRLSLGHHRGDTLQCQYHGWRFASGDGACRAVPAHPKASAPPIHATTWPAIERYGFVWTCESADRAATAAFPPIDALAAAQSQDCVPLRTTTIDADLASVRHALSAYVLPHADAAECAVFECEFGTLTVESLDGAASSAIFVLQPARAGKTRVHGVVPGEFDAAQRLALQRTHQARLNAVRDALEAAGHVQAASLTEALTEALAASSTDAPEPNRAARAQPLPVAVAMPLVRMDAARRAVSSAVDASRDEGGPFTVHLARSGGSVDVPANISLLDALRAHGVEVPTSCEQGVCGTCLTRVLDGEPLHRDAWLDARERAAGDCMMVCVSRARTPTLTLDL
ncbi:Rieske 2Fe-2S domain-containing protein [Paraburkholderia sp. MMS20-SJTR3]|uniref:Rieske 2Fe-2S domain-containing protein n=1 Tax=Paraburkholderia sejongensis TaxID=2886946 RepID=A0ABS8JR22_9BURK|nr:Rieske 2Fe-2S domain-containing protein [Paraburkholderia sp. MMS20-SJTR3]MCC8392341.1 Rieske 2Fe-2S domain-containing protein [Paraburkholderia sp. MMS20-SJTR3]